MPCYESRLQRLEAKWPLRHFLAVVRIPWELDVDDEARWLWEDVTCACGQKGCPELQVGAILPEKAQSPSAEAWAARVQRDQERRSDEERTG